MREADRKLSAATGRSGRPLNSLVGDPAQDVARLAVQRLTQRLQRTERDRLRAQDESRCSNGHQNGSRWRREFGAGRSAGPAMRMPLGIATVQRSAARRRPTRPSIVVRSVIPRPTLSCTSAMGKTLVVTATVTVCAAARRPGPVQKGRTRPTCCRSLLVLHHERCRCSWVCAWCSR